ncbi:MAG: 16S rRNA (adenine(1518)-N(6)/adenine(1519)-N(6))-dimethyltransferase RsmA [Gemmatimonadetes bacterium]|nr:16S rRNA (adenine(1518)-N(6)/adenine(1519)-N(6))-dimethyltransferase RsmA [Gemmatimonadota bacterium]
MSTAFDPPGDLLAELRRSAFRPSRTRGQHFLNDPSIARRIVEAAGVTPNTAVLEIGPGAGALTRHLVTRAGRITAVEIDARLARILEEAYGHYDHLAILNHDVLDLDLPELMEGSGETGFVIVANLPYGITGPVLDRLITHHGKITRAVIMVQGEVGGRLTASPGTKAYGAITAILAFHYGVESLFHVGGDRFVPRPAVDSVVLRLTPHDRPPVDVRDPSLLTVLIRAAFQHRRKMLHHAVSRLAPGSAAYLSDRTGIDLKRRGETLDLAEFAALADALREYGDHRKDHS